MAEGLVSDPVRGYILASRQKPCAGHLLDRRRRTTVAGLDNRRRWPRSVSGVGENSDQLAVGDASPLGMLTDFDWWLLRPLPTGKAVGGSRRGALVAWTGEHTYPHRRTRMYVHTFSGSFRSALSSLNV
jgi:hypothetical protein